MCKIECSVLQLSKHLWQASESGDRGLTPGAPGGAVSVCSSRPDCSSAGVTTAELIPADSGAAGTQ